MGFLSRLLGPKVAPPEIEPVAEPYRGTGKIDDGSWHLDAAETDAAAEAATIHLGCFVRWAASRGFYRGAAILPDRERRAVPRLLADVAAMRSGDMTGQDFIYRWCDGKLFDQQLDGQGRAFAVAYYVEDMPPDGANYFGDYEALFGDTPPVEESDAVFDAVAAILDRRFAEFCAYEKGTP